MFIIYNLALFGSIWVIVYIYTHILKVSQSYDYFILFLPIWDNDILFSVTFLIPPGGSKPLTTLPMAPSTLATEEWLQLP